MRCFIRTCNNGAVRVTVGPIKIPAPINAPGRVPWRFYASTWDSPFCNLFAPPSPPTHRLSCPRCSACLPAWRTTCLSFPQDTQTLQSNHTLFNMDRQSVFSSRLYDTPADSEDSNTHIRSLLESFILDFRLDNLFIYRSALPWPDCTLARETNPRRSQRPTTRKCAPQKVLLRRQHWRPDQVQRGDRPQIGDGTGRSYPTGTPASLPTHLCAVNTAVV